MAVAAWSAWPSATGPGVLEPGRRLVTAMSPSSRGADNGRPEGARLHEYELPGGWRVLAGRSETDNDRLSLRLARPEDWWFHARGQSGSHVVLQGPPGARPDRETLRTAAAVAAWHSKARGGGLVAVSCTLARFVSKPRGARPGTVQIRRETVLRVRPALPPPPG